jgi:hypothetical protein
MFESGGFRRVAWLPTSGRHDRSIVMAAKTTPTSIGAWSKKSHRDAKQRIRDAMSQIEIEIANNEGMFPGRLSISEVCRRAGISRATLEKATHKTSTLPEVVRWIGKVQARLPKGARARRSEPAKRAQTYKERLEAVCQQYHEAELEMIGLRRRLQELEGQLLAQSKKASNVIPISGEHSKKRG